MILRCCRKRKMALDDFYLPLICIHLLLFAYSLIRDVAAAPAPTDTILEGQRLGLSNTITSAGQVFELGFFSPQNSTSLYLGIWYKNIGPRTVVWVGNRAQPITSSSPYLSLDQGNLVIVDDRITYRISDLLAPRNTSLLLLDSGNLVLRDGKEPSIILWQSFDDPTDTFLPGMKLGIDKTTGKIWSLTAWNNENDPTPGRVSLRLNPRNLDEFIILRQNETYWSSGSWNGRIFSNVHEMRLNYIFNFSLVINENMSYFVYSLYNPSILSRCIIDGTSGQLRQLSWLESTKQWNLFWSVPKDNCDVYSFCGPFSSCRSRLYDESLCQCLEGFIRSDSVAAHGCTRKVPLQCEESGSVQSSQKDGFRMLTQVLLPLNPNITNAKSEEVCKSICLKDCSCNAYAYNGSGGCLSWNGDILNLRQLAKDDSTGKQMYLKLAAYELQDEDQGDKRTVLKIVVALVASLLLLFLATFVYCHLKKKRKRKREEAEDVLLFDVDMMGISVDYPSDQANRKATGNDSRLPHFSFASVSAATDNFSQKNKLGQGGFGPVYKGKILNGQEVAVKRLSRKSAQGMQELRTETTLIAKLQHRNLVRILGCCLEKGEKILIYELMPNRSLDLFIFDPSKRGLLDWTMRARIIEGIAQGLLYLHEHSRFRVIHRDLKASNILLDKDMNPKISDFGLAKMFGGNSSQANTNHIVGTYGYMSPEYAMEGIFSIKSDVFSYGVLLLEIISATKNTGFYQSDSLNLISYAWELWCGDVPLRLVDPVLKDRCSDDTMKRYINIGLLCVQEIAARRPVMSEVVSMLINEDLSVPSPERPAFSYSLLGATKMTNGPCAPHQPCSSNDITISAMEAR